MFVQQWTFLARFCFLSGIGTLNYTLSFPAVSLCLSICSLQGRRHRYGHYGHGRSTFWHAIWPLIALAIALFHKLFTQASVFDETVYVGIL